MKAFLPFALCLALVQHTFAQVYSDKVVGRKNEALSDSIKTKPYPYILPIWGEKAAKRGFDLPYSAGLNINYLYQQSDIIINNLQVGFSGSPMQNLDQVIQFHSAVSTTNAVNFRPDIWLLPFLNVYGIFAQSKSSTNVDFGISVPNSSGVWSEVFRAQTKAKFDGTTMGFGMTPTIGVGGGFLAIDMNCAWTDIAALEKPAFTFVLGPRLGKSFRFKKERALAIWAGGFRVKLKSETNGSLPLNELFDTQGLETKIQNGTIKVEEAHQDNENWWNGLTETEQKNPINQGKYDRTNEAIETASNFLNGMQSAVNRVDNGSVQYSLDKKQKDLWNFIVGAQYQFNKHFILRAEAGFLTSRTQFLAGLQYRFGL